MRATLVPLLALLASFTLAACVGEATTPTDGTTTGHEGDKPNGDGTAASGAGDLGTTLAVVGTVKVGSKEFEAAASRKTPASGESLTEAEKKEVLADLVDQKILYQEAKKKGIDEDPKVQKLMIQTLMRNEVYANVRNADFSQEDLRKYYDEHRDEFIVPEKVQVKRVFVRFGETRPKAEAKKLADQVHGKIKANPNGFKEVAAEYSEDPYKKRGGDLGFMSKEGKAGIDQAVVDMAFTLQVNQVSEVFETADGYNVVMVANKRDKVERTFDQMKGSVLRKVKNDRFRELYEQYVSNVRGNYQVQTFEDELGKIKVEPPKRMAVGDMPGMGPMPGMIGHPGGEPGEDGPGEGGEDDEGMGKEE